MTGRYGGAHLVDGVEPHLVEVYEENHVVPQARHAVHQRHGDGEGEHVVHEGVERLPSPNRESRGRSFHCRVRIENQGGGSFHCRVRIDNQGGGLSTKGVGAHRP
eukprot:368916-Prorocentrum_minimum.AAC.1